MPEHIRALIVILALALPTFAVLRRIMCPALVSAESFALRRNVWLAITVLAFLAHNFWVFIIASALVLAWGRTRESNWLVLYFSLLLVVPPMAGAVPGFGVINYFFELNFPRLLSLVVLLPAYLNLRQQPGTVPFGHMTPDKLLFAYLALLLVLQLPVDTFTNAIRHGAFYPFLDVFLPYYVASRLVRNLSQLSAAMAALVMAVMALAGISVFEFAKHWLLYGTLDSALGLNWDAGQYLGRGEVLRATATGGHSIVLGYLFAVALGLYLGLSRSMADGRARMLGAAILVLGLIAAMSRGPWLGAAVIVVVFTALGPHAMPRILKLAVVGALVGVAVLVSPYGEKVVDYLPFVGTVDAENITYRERLMELSLQIIWQNPVFGSYDFILWLEELRNGSQGIIDIVNSYIAIALRSGLVGLGLFSSFFIVVAFGVFRVIRTHRQSDPELESIGRAWLATTLGILFMIFTVSSILFIPTVYWTLAGVGVAIIGFAQQSSSDVRAASVRHPGALRGAHRVA